MTPFLRAILVAAAALAFAAPAQAQHKLVLGATRNAFELKDTTLTVLRSRAVMLDLPALANAAADPSPFVQVAFFDDAVYQVFIRRTERTLSGGTAYVGNVAASPQDPVVIVDNAGTVAVLFAHAGRRYSLQGTPEGGYVAREHLAFDPPDHGPGYQAPPSPTLKSLSDSAARGKAAPKDLPTYSPPPVAVADDGTTIDVMVVYTPEAVAFNGSQVQMDANVDAQVSLTNTIYENSNAVQRLRLVYKGPIAYTEAGMDTDLPRMALPSDGFMDELPMLRDLYKADLVSLWGKYNDYCGLGYLMATESASFEFLGYNIVSSPGCTGAGAYTFAHELGHNMGLRHDNFVDSGTNTVTAAVDGAEKTSFYSHGYYDLVNHFRTVMSYDNACQAQLPTPFSCNRIPRISNPDVSYLNPGFALATTGKFTATPPGNGYPGTGVAGDAFAAEALNDTRETTANFRTPQLALPFAGPGTVSFLPAFYSVAEGGATVTLTVGRHVGSAGAISVQFATGSGTATEGADFAAQGGTLEWADGETADKTIVVAVTQDAILEGHETFTVTIGSPTGGATVNPAGATATVRITDDEPDRFPVGTLLPGGFVTPNVPNANTPNSMWSVDLTDGSASPVSLQSAQAYAPDGTLTTFGNSDLEYTGVFRAGSIDFDHKFSGYQSGLSGFEFQIDGVAVFSNNVGGEVPWTPISQPVTAGVHTLRWRFKNKLPFPCASANPPATGGASCADRAWIDNLAMPLARPFDLSAEGRTDLVWANDDGRVAVWLMDGTAATNFSELIGAGSGWSVTQVGDFDGNGKSDLVWSHIDGRMAIYLMNGELPALTTQLLNAGAWKVTHAADLNGDGRSDLVFENTDGTAAVWMMNGTAMTSGASIIGAGTGWTVIRTADFDGDGKRDLLWRHVDGRHAIWLMNGAVIGATTQILNGGGWTATHTPDLDGDGRADIVWQHTDGTIAVWLMNAATMTSGTGLLGAGTGWSVVRTGDFDADGKSDLLFGHADGRAAIYLMDGIVPKATQQILNAGGGWSARRLGDLDGNGKADILWENVDGRTAAWLMNGTTMSSSKGLIGVGTGWRVNDASQ